VYETTVLESIDALHSNVDMADHSCQILVVSERTSFDGALKVLLPIPAYM